jgi:hypothetical protein
MSLTSGVRIFVAILLALAFAEDRWLGRNLTVALASLAWLLCCWLPAQRERNHQ